MTTTKKNIDVKKAAANDKEVPEVINNEALVLEAQKKVDDLKKQLSEAKEALRKLTGKKSNEPKGPGVISTILTLVTNSGKEGISKEALLNKLVEMFPDRAKEGMGKTINVQLCGRINKEKGVNIQKTDKGNFVLVK